MIIDEKKCYILEQSGDRKVARQLISEDETTQFNLMHVEDVIKKNLFNKLVEDGAIKEGSSYLLKFVKKPDYIMSDITNYEMSLVEVEKINPNIIFS